MKILVVDDQPSARRVLQRLFRNQSGIEILQAATLDEARDILTRNPIELAFIDLRLTMDDPTNRDGLVLVQELSERTSTRSIIVTGIGDMLDVRAAMRAGAYDYILKEDISPEVVLPLVERVRSRRRLEDEVLTLRAREQPSGGSAIIGSSPALQRVRELTARVAVSDLPVLILGPSGAGKELVVKQIHSLGPHPAEPLLALNCATFPANLLEAILFGYEPGMFSGGDPKGRDGFLSTVGRGTLYLDEIAEMPLELQPKLLRVLQEGRFRPIGGEERSFEGRVVAATNQDLQSAIAERSFREDLFYRLNVLRIRVPPLSERRQDIPELLNHFLSQQSRRIRFTAEAIELLCRAPWPGNIRQLQNLVGRTTVMLQGDEAGADEVRTFMDEGNEADYDPMRSFARDILSTPYPGDKLALARKTLIAEALHMSAGTKTEAAKLLGVNRKVIERAASSGDNGDAKVAAVGGG